MALSIGIRNSISLLSAIQATRLLTITLVGLTPTEHTSFSWTRFRTAGFPQYGFKAGISDEAFPTHRFAIVLRALCFHRDSLLCVVNVRGTTRLTSAATGEFVNHTCDGT